ncbi:hypothetical protein EXU48_18230 [Occultella glacieicola]|uniref:Lipoprotein n=1 Tax=Occultella glacieicola TaxID=2518684 RepID=A0ABY2E347_9MICO|nr:hypothetical protein [Occultella glacieicola]TDE90391.1 hypothetical protein EXU48_18230 [Occultella glacieicola]
MSAAAVAGVLLLAGCGGGTEEPETGTDPTVADAAAEEPEEPAQEETTEEPESTYDVDAIDFGDPAAVTAPGTPLTLGQVAWVERTVTFGETEVTGTQGISVLQITESDPSLFDQYSNADEFADYVPYLIVTQQQWVGDVPEDETPPSADLFPLLADGADAEYLTSQFSFNSPGDECGLELPPFDESTGTAVSCFVGLSNSGQPVNGVEYNGEGYYSFVATPGNLYLEQPIIWQ